MRGEIAAVRKFCSNTSKKCQFFYKICKLFNCMLRQSWRKRYLINPPPPKKEPFFFGGGVSFLEYFHKFLGLWHKKNFWNDFGAKPMFWDNYLPIPDILWLWKIQKIWANFATFFFKIRFWTKLVLEPLKLFFSDIF